MLPALPLNVLLLIRTNLNFDPVTVMAPVVGVYELVVITLRALVVPFGSITLGPFPEFLMVPYTKPGTGCEPVEMKSTVFKSPLPTKLVAVTTKFLAIVIVLAGGASGPRDTVLPA